MNNQTIKDFANSVSDIGGSSYFIGRSCREMFFRNKISFFSIEVHGIDCNKISEILTRLDIKFNRISTSKIVGDNFSITTSPVDKNSIPEVVKVSIPDIEIYESLKMRNFTINAIAFNIATGDIIDPFNGLFDIEKRILSHVGKSLYSNPINVLKGMRYIATYRLTPTTKTINACSRMSLEYSKKEDMFNEFAGLIIEGTQPSRGLDFLKETGIVFEFPELSELIKCEQSKSAHPEGDVFNHTKHTLDYAVSKNTGNYDDIIVGLAALCHDMGKPVTYGKKGYTVTNYDHAYKGVPVAESFLRRITNDPNLINNVLILVKNHMKPSELYKNKNNVKKATIAKLKESVVRTDLLLRLSEADHFGRPPLNEPFLKGDWLKKKFEECDKEEKEEKIKPIIGGKELISMGLTPGIGFKNILEKCLQKQKEGKLSSIEEGKMFVKSIL